MSQPKKYGAFAGVFTPSILTILGVIMYMRLPWITGQSGLYMVLGIVLVAHIVSICTGLSVSSIATDKKVEGGGSYYIISRSLGLSLGGTLGIALFFGLSFSVSLYIIGFSESFNNYWGLGNSINAIRLTGTTILVLVTILTFVSTSLALKLQFFILAAIFLSLLSIFFGHSAYVPEKIALLPQVTAPSMMVLFGIFFPAVTGFEAGVSMSGDLQEPQKSIPIGTIFAILVGLAVYIGFPIFLLHRVDIHTLINNPNVLLEISIYAPLVIAGIWAATISSAIGSILGAPRILQATAVDNITPKFFAKGHGKENEPRNALMLTFIIAEAGILIGELDVIARVVSTFFITTYGFLNFSCVVESWASSDFRPTFKVPKVVGILGFLTCLIVMIQLDLLAMIGGTIILGGLLFFLKSRELTLKSGDAWESVWLSIVRMGLFKLSQGGRSQRNWKPNILLFSGGTTARPHLIQFGKWTAGQLGMVSNFDLIETPSAKVLFPKSKQAVVTDSEEFEGVFIRRQECQDVYEGINTIVRTYGFSGIEPNTVLLGWGKKTKDPEKFVQLLTNIRELDFNQMLMSYNEQKGFGEFKSIDIWWRGAGNNGNFSLALAKFILAGFLWRNARLRFLIVTMESALIETIHKNMTRTLQEARLTGDVKIINNAAEQRSFEEIISVESATTDLTILGLPDIFQQNAQAVIEKTNRIISNVGTTLLIHASSFFNDVVTGIEYESKIDKPSLPDDAFSNFSAQTLNLPNLALPADELLKTHVADMDQFVVDMIFKTVERHFLVIHDRNRNLTITLGDLTTNTLGRIDGLLKEDGSPKTKRAIAKLQGDLFFQFNRLIAEFKATALTNQKDMLEEAIRGFSNRMEAYWQDLPEKIVVLHSREAIQAHPADRMLLKWSKWAKRVACRFRKDCPPSVKVNFQRLAGAAWNHLIWEKWLNHFQQMAIHQYFWAKEIQRMLKAVKDRLDGTESRFLDKSLSSENMTEAKSTADLTIERIQQLNDKIFFEFIRNLLRDARQAVNQVAIEAGSIDVAFYYRQHLKNQNRNKQIKLNLQGFAQAWLNNQTLLVEMMLMDLALMAFQRRLFIIFQRIKRNWFLSLETGLHVKIETLIANIRAEVDRSENDLEVGSRLQFDAKTNLIPEHVAKYIAKEIEPAFENIPESAQAIAELSLQQIEKGRFIEMDGLSVDLRELLEYIVYAELLDPLRQHLSEIPLKIEVIISHVKEALRFITFNLSSPEFLGESLVGNDHPSLIQQAITRIEKEKEAAAELQQQLMETIDQGLNKLSEKINPYLIIQSANDLRRYIRQQDSKKVISIFGKEGRRLETWAQKRLIEIISRRNERLLKSRREKNASAEPPVKEIMVCLETVSPKSQVLNDLPFHYKQFFLSDQPPSKDLWVGRETELARGQAAITRFRSGKSGALMITGERFSGKSALSLYIAQLNFDRQTVFQVLPPDEGSCSLEVFHQTMETVFQVRGSTEHLFQQIPSQSVLVFHDLELWWERHPQGNAIMNHIEWMIREFGHQCFFILNMNVHTLKLIRTFDKIDEYFLDQVVCSPITVEELKTLILLRHRATGLKFKLNNQTEDTLSELALTRLFSRFHKYSKGNAGMSLHSWVRHIENVRGNTLQISPPLLPELLPLKHMPMDWMLVLVQFVLHKILSPTKLMRLMGWEEPQFKRFIDVLYRAGILQNRGDGLWSITPYIEPFLTDQLRARNLL